jgi:hypothetical protein
MPPAARRPLVKTHQVQRIEFDTQIHPYRQCEVCGHSPTAYTVRVWAEENTISAEDAEILSQHSFCVIHRSQADRLHQRLVVESQ